MREIKFRGKGIVSNKWYYGDLIIVNDTDKSRHYYIIADEYSDEDGNIPNTIKLDTCNSPEVDKETVGQYTGLKDKNGKEIYDGDILKIVDTEYGWTYIANVEFVEGSFVLNMKKGEFRGELLGADCWEEKEKEVIGNTTDNPELLEEE